MWQELTWPKSNMCSTKRHKLCRFHIFHHINTRMTLLEYRKWKHLTIYVFAPANSICCTAKFVLDITQLIIEFQSSTMCASGKFRVIVTFMVFLSVLHLHANWEYPPVPIVEEMKSDNHTRDIRSIAKGRLNDCSILCDCFYSFLPFLHFALPQFLRSPLLYLLLQRQLHFYLLH